MAYRTHRSVGHLAGREFLVKYHATNKRIRSCWEGALSGLWFGI